MRDYQFVLRSNGSDVHAALELHEGGARLARVELIDAHNLDQGAAERYEAEAHLMHRLVDLVASLHARGLDSARVASRFADVCAFIEAHPLEQEGRYPHDPGDEEAAQLSHQEDPPGQG